MSYTYIDTLTALEKCSNELLNETTIAVDTEMHPYHGYLCLIQISTASENFIIDAKVLKSKSLQALKQVFESEAITKLFCGDDDYAPLFKINLRLNNVIDVQTIYRAVEISPKLINKAVFKRFGFKHMCSDVLNIEVSKKFQRSDWSRRPLSDGQKEYAMLDTKYLIEIASILFEKLSEEELVACKSLSKQALKYRLHKCQLYPEGKNFDPDFKTLQQPRIIQYLSEDALLAENLNNPIHKLISKMKTTKNSNPVFKLYPKIDENSGYLVSCEIPGFSKIDLQCGYRNSVVQAVEDAARLVLIEWDYWVDYDYDLSKKLTEISKMNNIKRHEVIDFFDDRYSFNTRISFAGIEKTGQSCNWKMAVNLAMHSVYQELPDKWKSDFYVEQEWINSAEYKALVKSAEYKEFQAFLRISTDLFD